MAEKEEKNLIRRSLKGRRGLRNRECLRKILRKRSLGRRRLRS